MEEIKVKLSKPAINHFNEVMYSLDLPHKHFKDINSSDVVSHCLEECSAFEFCTGGNQITNYLMTKYPKKYKEWKFKNHIIPPSDET